MKANTTKYIIHSYDEARAYAAVADVPESERAWFRWMLAHDSTSITVGAMFFEIRKAAI